MASACSFSCSLGEIQVVHVLRDVGIILVPMLVLLMIIIVFPEFVLFFPAGSHRSSSESPWQSQRMAPTGSMRRR